jgi:hypothetical protein
MTVKHKHIPLNPHYPKMQPNIPFQQEVNVMRDKESQLFAVKISHFLKIIKALCFPLSQGKQGV